MELLELVMEDIRMEYAHGDHDLASEWETILNVHGLKAWRLHPITGCAELLSPYKPKRHEDDDQSVIDDDDEFMTPVHTWDSIRQLWETAYTLRDEDYWCNARYETECDLMQKWILSASTGDIMRLTQNTDFAYNYDVMWIMFFNAGRLADFQM